MKVFLSSTRQDLEAERDAVYAALSAEYEVVRMEDFGSRGEDALRTCLDELEHCDVYVLLVGHRYGSIAVEPGLSYTQTEYERARELGLHVLAYIREGFDAALPSSDDPLRLSDFRDQIEEAHVIARPYFSDATQLATQVKADVSRYHGRALVRPTFGRFRRGIHDPVPYGIGTARRNRLQLYPFRVVLVDTGVIDQEQYPAERARRMRIKVRDIRAGLAHRGVNVLVFNEIDSWATADQVVQERAAEVRRAASAVICLVDGAASVGAVQLFEGASGSVGVWYPRRVESSVPKIPKAVLRSYTDRDISTCSVTLRVLTFLDSLIDSHLVGTLSDA